MCALCEKRRFLRHSTLISIIIDKRARESGANRVYIWHSAPLVQLSSQYDFYWRIIRIKRLGGSGYLVYAARLHDTAILAALSFTTLPGASLPRFPVQDSGHSDIGNAIFIRFLGARISSRRDLCLFYEFISRRVRYLLAG